MKKIIVKKECIPIMGFRHSHIGIKISNQFVCCYLINPIKSGIKKERSYEWKEKKKTFFYGKKETFLLGKNPKLTL